MTDFINRTSHRINDNNTTASSGAGAIPLSGRIHQITTTAADALTLADGFEGQRITLVLETDGGDGTLTPTNLAGGTTIVFDNADTAEMLFTGGTWYMLGGIAVLS